MSSYSEDIIRETFEKLGDAIGVQMQIPDAMIANLGAVLQAQIDLLAELQSTGRLLADDEMRLTAEEVEDVRTAREALRGYRNFEGSISRGHIRGLIAAVDALFPVTEPAEPAASEGVNCGANSVVLGWCTLSAQHEGLHTNGTYFWGQAPAPAEPAEEETKAEYPRTDGDFTVLGPEIFTDASGEFICWKGVNYVRQPDPASSPVVPAPTETGPWMHADEIPNDVTVVTDRDKRTWKYSSRTDKWTHRSHGQTRWVYGYPDPCFAPFVAAEEG